VRAFVLRDSHYYPFLIQSAPLLARLESALLELVTNFFPTPEEPPPPLSPPRPALSDFAPIGLPPVIALPQTPSDPREYCQWWAPLIVQQGDLRRLWLSPTNRQRFQLIALCNVRTLEDLVFSGRIPVSCAIRARPLHNTATCRPDRSCGLQMACLISLVADSSLSFPSHQWHFQPSDRRFQFRQASTNWLLLYTLPDSTRAKIQGTIQWFDSGSRGLLPPDHWFSNHDIQYVLDTDWDVALWTQLGAPNWEDWSFIESTTRTLQQHDHLPWSDLQQYLQPHRLQSCLSHSHFSPWYCPPVVSSLLPLAIQSLLEKLVAQPLPVSGTQGNVMRITSRIRSSVHREVLILRSPVLLSPRRFCPPLMGWSMTLRSTHSRSPLLFLLSSSLLLLLISALRPCQHSSLPGAFWISRDVPSPWRISLRLKPHRRRTSPLLLQTMPLHTNAVSSPSH